MKKLVVVLVIAAIILGGVIYGESNRINSNNPQATSNSNIISATKNTTFQSFSDNEILNVANSSSGSSNYNFNTVLNREISGNIMKAEMKNSNNPNVYVGNFDIVNNNLALDGPIKLINNEGSQPLLSNGKKDTISENSPKQNINTVSSNNNSGNSNMKSSNFIGATIENNKTNNNINISSGNEAINLALQYYSKLHNGINKENLQRSVLANQAIGGQNGYLVQIYNSEGNKDVTNAVYLITKNGGVYNGNTDPLQKLN